MHFRYRATEGSSYEQHVPGGLELLRVSVTLSRMSIFFTLWALVFWKSCRPMIAMTAQTREPRHSSCPHLAAHLVVVKGQMGERGRERQQCCGLTVTVTGDG